MLIAQLSDPHIVAAGRKILGRVDTPACLERAVAHVNGLIPRADLVLLTGDLVDDGTPESYANLRRILDRLQAPYAVLPGNHDDRENLRAAFPDLPDLPRDGGFLHYTIEDRPLRVVALDTIVPGEVGGALCRERLDWLEQRLGEAPDRPTLIAMHHPPFASGIEEMDAINCANSAALGALLERHAQVVRIVCGHIHRPITFGWAGTVVTTAPSTAHQVALDLRPGAPVTWVAEPPACQLHYWLPESGLVTHLSYIGDYGGPQAFH
jgi:3',5'-cyclic AMP phosphodiesterase CpdA